jgi:hypothetical protein
MTLPVKLLLVKPNVVPDNELRRQTRELGATLR